MAYAEYDNRNVVAWLQPPDANVAFCALVHDQSGGHCTVMAVDTETFAIHAAHTRTLIIPVVDTAGFVERAKAAIRLAHVYGVQILLMTRTESRDAAPPTSAELAAFERMLAQLDLRVGSWQPFMENRWQSAASHVGGSLCEPAANSNLRLEGDKPDDDECTALLQRAFRDCETLYLRKLGVGRSGAETWRVAMNARDAQQTSTEFVVKIETSDNSREKSGFALVQDTIPSRLYAPIVEQRSCDGHNRNAVVYRFLARSQPLLERLAEGALDLVESLFDHTFAQFHQPIETAYEKLGPIFSGLQYLPDTEELTRVADETSARGLPTWPALRAKLLGLPPVECTFSKIHGDLHPGNLFVHVGTKDVAVIDYATVTPKAPRVWDVACLEVSLVFPADFIRPENWPIAPADDAIRAAFQYPLVAENVDRWGFAENVAAAIKAVRTCVKDRKDDRAAYAIAVATALLRFASFDDNGGRERRVQAYVIASDLIRAAEDDLRERYAAKV
jgi:hypothetical protein